MAGPATQQITNSYKQLTDQNSLGSQLGASSTDKWASFGATPIVQPSGAFQTTPSVAASLGNVTEYSVSLSPSAVTANTTAEQTFTVTGLLTTDLVFVNKPTQQAGLAVASCRVSAANTVAITFVNNTSGSITPTASEVYTVVSVPASLQLSSVLTPASVAANTTAEQQFTIVGLVPGMVTEVNKPSTQAGLAIVDSRVVSANVLGITYANVTASPITPTAAETYLVFASNGLSAISNVMEYGVNVGTLSGVATITTAEQSVAVTGLLANDVIMGVSKPTLQAGLGIAGYRVSSAGNIGITFVNPTAGTVTPTASEVYKTSAFRLNPAPVMQVITQTLTPVSVAANTTAEQTFTVPGLASGTLVRVDKPSIQTGVGLGQARVSATNTLALTFINTTSSAITPAAEAYVIGYFPALTQPAGGYVQQAASSLIQGMFNLAGAIQSALVSLGIIKGS